MAKFLDPNLEQLQQTLKSVFEIPVYQRPYKWEKEQIQELFADMMDEYKLAGRFFLGTLFMSQNGTINSNTIKYEVVDGQQRLTTIALILLVFFSKIDERNANAFKYHTLIKDLLWKQKDLSNSRECRLVTSGQLEKHILEEMFDWCFDSPHNFIKKVNDKKEDLQKAPSSVLTFTKCFYDNITHIDNCIKEYVLENNESKMSEDDKQKKYCLFLNYLFDSVYVITITLDGGVNQDRKKLFEIFESINGKGRKLDEIDLIKSYIFQNIDTDHYDDYLTKWGELIKKTNDNLDDYLGVFINSKIKYYKNSINVKTFKSFTTTGLKTYYEENTIGDTLERFIDDMVNNVDNYVKLTQKGSYLIKDDKFRFFTDALRKFGYTHPKALLFRIYCDFNQGKASIKKKQLIDLTKNAVIFMVLYQTLQQKDSRETAGEFEQFMKLIYENSDSYYDVVNKKMQSELDLAALNQGSIRSMLKKHVGYEQSAKRETKFILSAYECFDDSTNKFSYDKMRTILNEDRIQVDHIAVRHPDKNDSNYSYYAKDDDTLVLKKGSDFTNNPNISAGMDYDLFLANSLHKTGNLQLMWASTNVNKSNGVLVLKTYTNHYTYSDIENRAEKIADALVDNGFFELSK